MCGNVNWQRFGSDIIIAEIEDLNRLIKCGHGAWGMIFSLVYKDSLCQQFGMVAKDMLDQKLSKVR